MDILYSAFRLAIILTCLFHFGHCLEAQTETTEAKVQFRLFNLYGQAIDAVEVLLTNRDTRDQKSLKVKNLQTLIIPYGHYEVRALAPGFNYKHTKINVDRPQGFITLGFELGSFDGSTARMRVNGIITVGSKGAGDAWIRFITVFSDLIIESRTDMDGRFTAELPGGEYIVLSQYSQALDIRRLRIDAASRFIKIDIDNRPAKR